MSPLNYFHNGVITSKNVEIFEKCAFNQMLFFHNFVERTPRDETAFYLVDSMVFKIKSRHDKKQIE